VFNGVSGYNYIPLNTLTKAENMSAKIAYVDASRGVSGTLLIGALCAHGFSGAALQKTIASVVSHGYQVEVQEVIEQGIHGVRVASLSQASVVVRTYSEWIKAIQRSSLPEHVRQRALACLERLTEAEALVTGQEPQSVVLTAVTIIEVLGVVAGLDDLAIEQLSVSALPLGSGVVQTASGIESVPSPITLEILRHVRATWQPSPLADAIVTPVGAAILAVCAHFETLTLTLTIEQVGYGFAAANDTSGPLRICLGQSVPAEPLTETYPGEQGADSDWVTVIESHLDTMTGELLGGLMERLFAAGALDVTYTPIQMKKNRPATLITIICVPALGEMFALLLLRETTTLGVRTQRIRRLKAQREQIELSTSLGPMLVKVKRLGAEIISAAPEYEECRRLAHEHNIPLIDVYEVARHSIKSAII
jgi:pyridinium-3,5-bisthiocarboxylic acid mononucleotide nickel chelatase